MTVYIQPLKMELTQGSETSANYNLTPGKYPKEYIQYLYIVFFLEIAAIFNRFYTTLFLVTVFSIHIIQNYYKEAQMSHTQRLFDRKRGSEPMSGRTCLPKATNERNLNEGQWEDRKQ